MQEGSWAPLIRPRSQLHGSRTATEVTNSASIYDPVTFSSNMEVIFGPPFATTAETTHAH